MQREAQLAKEAKYEHGLRKSDLDYEDMISTMRDNNNAYKSDQKMTGNKTIIKVLQKYNSCCLKG